ncbi:MAG: NAD(P)H-dependent glycerol-3-phosphate dehydrogenase [Bacillota bacterium]|nr:NAD(P)H-dependent glycerol-3-phosphate dehydrogenase [Bacillota bacterium]
MNKVCVLGAGSWGTALAVILANNGYIVYLWGRPEDGIEEIKVNQENRRFLPGIDIPVMVKPTINMQEAMEGASAIIISIPAQAQREVLQQAKYCITDSMYLVNTAKGLEIPTGLRLSQVMEEVLGQGVRECLAILSGPSHAEEVGKGIPTAVTVAAYKKETAYFVQDLFMFDLFRVYTNPDVVGVELGGALKNVIALATGVIYGLGYGDNTVAALMTRGLAEIIRMGEALGGYPRTFAGLSGMGDLVVTCGSRYSRNRRAGELIGQGKGLEETLQTIGMVVEGVHTTRILHQLAQKMNVEMPITEACYNILYEDKSPRQEVVKLMCRQRKHEMEENAINLNEW